MFRNREEAGRQLGAALGGIEMVRPLVLGVPRGGVEIGAALARSIGAELDVVLARKLRAPMQPELAMGAVGEDGSVSVDHELARAIGATPEMIESERRTQVEEIQRRGAMIRAVRPAAPLEGRTVIVTDDGIATGSTMIAALKAAKAKGPYELIVAVPVGSPDRLEEIRRHCDRLVCLEAPSRFMAIGQFYEDFSQVPDARVLELLRGQAA
ncbi:MAG: hypothetical protein KDA22_14855 [Phycisphaerales bacterium]|nr:hypothetical protein [Phycisphaerales bacterium]